MEEALKDHESVSDALVIGLPDEKWGQSVNAVVSLHDGYELDEIALRDFTRKILAGYKLPKRILAKDDLERAPNGKANYKLIREYAARELGVSI